jgi:DDE superfamily endonuclease
VSGKGSGRISVAGLFCVHPEQRPQRPRLLYRVKVHRARKGERRSFAETDYVALLDAAYQYLKAPIVLIWDNLNTHISTAMRQLVAGPDWLHVIQLPAYAPDLNPTEGVWSHVKRSLGNLAAAPRITSPRSCATGSNASNIAPTSWAASSPRPA